MKKTIILRCPKEFNDLLLERKVVQLKKGKEVTKSQIFRELNDKIREDALIYDRLIKI